MGGYWCLDTWPLIPLIYFSNVFLQEAQMLLPFRSTEAFNKAMYPMMLAAIWEFIMGALCLVGPLACVFQNDPTYGLIDLGLGGYLFYRAIQIRNSASAREAVHEGAGYINIAA